MPAKLTDEQADALLLEIRTNADRAGKSEEDIRRAADRDLEFLTGKQWESGEPEARRQNGRPALTFNKLPPFVDQIVNDERRQKPGVRVSPVGGGADKQTAEIYEGIIRHIEYASQADVAYDTAFDYAVSSSFGWWKYSTDYADDRSTDQEIKVVRVADPKSVLMDPYAKEPDLSDATWAIEWDRISREEFKRRYPKSETAETSFAPAGGFTAPDWIEGDNCLIARYWRVEPESKQLWIYRGIPAPDPDPDPARFAPPVTAGAAPRPGALPAAAPGMIPAMNPGVTAPGMPPPNGAAFPGMAPPVQPAPAPAPDADEQGYVRRGFYEDEDIPPGFVEVTDDDGDPEGREVEIRHVWMYETNGHEVLGKPKEWAGKYIPIVPCYGKEKIVKGVRVLLSAIRFALDPSQLYNYYKTTEAEVIQQTPKNPYIGALGQFRTMQAEWALANVVPRTTLEYDPVAVGGQLAPPPQRQPYVPQTEALIAGASSANEDIKATTGLFDPSRGASTPNADSGLAINLLQQQGQTATFHFFDNFLRSMWHGYRILLDLIPRIYDTPRVIRILKPDTTAELIQINRMFTGDDGKRLKYDLAQGTYSVAVTVQQAYPTRRLMQTAQLAELAKADPQQLPQWADLYVRNLDMGPLGDEIADRLTPPEYRAGAADPRQLQTAAGALQQQNQQLQEQVNQLTQALVTKSYEVQAKTAQNEQDNRTKLAIAQMQEETRRMSDAIKLAIAEIGAKAQTGQRALSDFLASYTEREAMAHDLAMKAHDRAVGVHDSAANLASAGAPGGPPPAGAPAASPPAGGGPIDPAALANTQNPPNAAPAPNGAGAPGE